MLNPRPQKRRWFLYYKSSKSGRIDRVSRQFARSLLPALGAGARVRGQGLGVLYNNPADVKVLIELRNMAYRDHVWALRFEDLRHRDAEKSGARPPRPRRACHASRRLLNKKKLWKRHFQSFFWVLCCAKKVVLLSAV